ncbi:prevent-host-death family protein [Streptosporangium becharense]|uniref:Antitoxin n=1 Tax=Streptosporangium becharense TaxID=1816182 RepID=A0A7W9ILM3_9ACTN|nr:type II toxin-antitoxin system Phd/YefM family antitoxin [Streptosporangium becharense]MBB2910128.1 prevent-host-death family protein [Streptosporangium becharense]MBB5822871.1 prevent-host-death family protein [Streptosporangium becharense]
MAGWQVQEAKQRFSEVVRRAVSEGPQVVTRHGEEVAVVIDIAEYRRLKEAAPDFRRFLLSNPDWEDDVDFPRNRDLPREVEFD